MVLGKALHFIILLALSLSFVPSSFSSLVIYNDRNQFINNLSNYSSIDFENEWRRPFPGGYTDGNIVINAPGGLYSTNWGGSNSRAVGSENSGTIDFSFAPGTKAIGFDIGFHYDRLEAFGKYTISGSSGVIGSNTGTWDPKLSIDKTGSFYGFISDEEDIQDLELYVYVPFVPAFPIIDNVIYGSPVPIPGAVWFLLTGFIAILGFRSRFKFFKMLPILFAALTVSFSMNAHAMLWDRGGGLIYDDVLDITWLKDANYAATSGHTLTLPNGSSTGYMMWNQAMQWADQLVYAGFDEWRLPDALNLDGSGPDHGLLASGEMGHMYYNNLGNSPGGINFNWDFIDGDGSLASFQNLQRMGYWTQTYSSYGPTYKWVFNFSNGATDYLPADSARWAWAVHDGDIGAVPIPGAFWLLGSGLFGLIGLKKIFSH